MPSHPCRHPTCTEYITAPGYCTEHAHLAPADSRERHRRYDRERRDPEAKKFYNSAAWQRARDTKLANQPTCEICGRFAEMVHHRTPVRESQEKRTDQDNLQSLCTPCHSKLEAEAAGGG
jgi:5-methylcytosine-specific restriction protein A